MIEVTVAEAAKACGGILNTDKNLERKIANIVIDSRTVKDGDLFVAYKGEKTDGHRFISGALDSGAACCLAEYVPDGEERPVITVPDVQEAIQKLGEYCRSKVRCPVIGVTGSVGKTTAKEMISSVLGTAMPVHRTSGNLNNHIGVPMTLSGITEEHGAAVVEMGISGFGEMSVLAAMARPNIAVYTVIGHAHLEFLHDLDGVLRAKTEMLDYMEDDALVIFNGDDEKQRSKQCKQRKVYYGLGSDCDVRAENIKSTETEIRCEIVTNDMCLPVVIPGFGEHMVYAALEGAAVGLALGLTGEQIARGIAAYKTLGRRGAVTDTGFITVIDDSYNGNPDSVKSSIDSLKLLPGRHVCVLGDMLELGENSPEMHYEVGAYAALSGMSPVLTAGPLSEYICRGAVENGADALHFESVGRLCEALPRFLRKGDRVLVQASRGMHLEHAAEAMKELKDPDAPCILLDLDDTILDFHQAERIALRSALRSMGLDPTDEVISRYSEINVSCWEKLETGEWTREEVLVNRFTLLFDEFGLNLSGKEARDRYEHDLCFGHYFMPGAEDMLEELKQAGYRLFIVSNGTAIVQDSRMESAGIGHYFEKIFISERMGVNKPAVEFFDRAFAEIPSFRKDNAILLGDSLTSDILGGLRAGVKTCRYNPDGKPGREDIVPDYEIQELKEFLPLMRDTFAYR